MAQGSPKGPPPQSLWVTSPNAQKVYSGRYDVHASRLVNGFPIWKMAGGERWIYKNSKSNIWQFTYSEEEIQKNLGHLASEKTPEVQWPHEVPGGTWQYLNKEFFKDEEIIVSAEIPRPPPSLWVTSPNAQKDYSGRYHVHASRLVNGFPIWKMAGGERWLYKNTANNWMFTGAEEDFQKNVGHLASKSTPNAQWPHEVPGVTWQYYNNEWIEDKEITVSAEIPRPPPSLRVTSPNAQKDYSGRYYVDANRLVNGFPIWKMAGGERWIYKNYKANIWQFTYSEDEIQKNLGHLASKKTPKVQWPHEVPGGTWQYLNDEFMEDKEIIVSAENDPEINESEITPPPRWMCFDGPDVIDILPEAPWETFVDPRGLVEHLRTNPAVRAKVPLVDRVIADVEAKVSQLRRSPASRELAAKLDDDELPGIVFYTHDNLSGTKAGNMYFEENRDLRITDTDGRVKMLRTWGFHVNVTLRGLGKLPNVAAEVYRGLPDKTSVEEYSEGLPIQFNAWTSTATQLRSATAFAGEDGVVLKLKIRTGKDICNLSMFNSENEVLLTPKHRFVVTRELYKDGGFWYVDLLETRAGIFEY